MRFSFLTRIVTVFLLTVFTVQNIFAQFEEGKILITTDKITGTSLVPNAPVYVPQAVQLYTADGYENSGLRKIKNLIKFSLNENSTTYFASDFSATVQFTVERKNIVGGTLVTSNESLTINYDKDPGVKYQPYSYLELPESEDVKIKITNFTITGASGWDPTPIMELSNEMRVTRYYSLASSPSLLTPSFSAVTDNGDNLLVSWTWPAGSNHNMSQLEWAWEENFTNAFYVSTDQLFNDNSTRVDLDYGVNSFKIPLLYSDSGKLYYRVRAGLRKNSGQVFNGAWHLATSYTFAGHEMKLNWQSSTSFAENGKSKTVIQYFDGSLRGRQIVTKDNSTNNTIVGETIYDLQGRPNVQILPTPTNDQTIKYFSNFNRFLNQSVNDDPARYFDLTPVAARCQSAPRLDSNYGNAKYYSNKNPWLLTEAKSPYIPDARGYAFSETRYMDDATGRIESQGGVGPDHQINSGHETKYFYGKPSQPELDALFATEAGYAVHYTKNMVQDANGQLSVSYVDMKGRTVATALAGAEPEMLQSIANATDYPMPSNMVKNDLTTPDNNIVTGAKIESVSSILVPARNEYKFTYALDPGIVQFFNCNAQQICFDCKYDLEISIKRENCADTAPIIRRYQNLQVVPSGQSCTVSMGFKGPGADTVLKKIFFTDTLEIGSYIVRKTLTVNDSMFQIRRDSAAKEMLCRTESQILDSVKLVLLTQSGCGQPLSSTADCSDCTSRLGLYSIYRLKYLAEIGLPGTDTTHDETIQQLYTQDSLACVQACGVNPPVSTLEFLRQQMLNDLIPFTGQYALDSTVNSSGQRIAIPASSIEAKFNIFSPTYTGSPASPYTKPFFHYPKKENATVTYYMNDEGVFPSSIYPDGPNDNSYLLTLNRDQFNENFERPWAGQLMAYHPELSKLQLAEGALKTSYEWMDQVMACNSYQQAVNWGFTNPVAADPYFVGNFVAGQSTTMQTYISSHVGTNTSAPSIWRMANGVVLCQDMPNGPLKENCIFAKNNTGIQSGITDSLVKNEIWEQFKLGYFSYRNDMLIGYINSQTTSQLSTSEMTQLQAAGKKLHFVRTLDIASQNNMPWWPNILNGDTTGTGVYTSTVFGPGGSGLSTASACAGQRPAWKQQLMQCDSLINLLNNELSSDSLLVETILDNILDGMEVVCQAAQNAQNPYGASNVPPGNQTIPSSFEQVISNVFSANGISTPASGYFCNPYTIAFPKPYGSNPPVVSNYTNVIDSCACKQFIKYKQEAFTLGFDTLSLNSMNQFFIQQYEDSITAVLWQGFQKCDTSFRDSCTYVNAVVSDGSFEAQMMVLRPDCYNPEITDVQHVFVGGVEYLEIFYNTDANCVTDTLFIRNAVTGDMVITTPIPCGTGSYLVQLPHCAQYLIVIKTYSGKCGSAQSETYYMDRARGCDCDLPVIDSVTIIHPNLVIPPNHDTLRNIMVHYSIPSQLTNCRIKVYTKPGAVYTHIATQYIPCNDSSYTFTLPSCQVYYFAIESYNEDSTAYCDTLAVSDTVKLNRCWRKDCIEIFTPIMLPDVVRMPAMFGCGFVKPCITCEKLQEYVEEFRATYPSFNGAPYLSPDATQDQLEQNSLLSRFLNYRTGFSKNAIDYMQAWLRCGLDTSSIGTDSIAICGDMHPLNDPGPVDSIPDPCENVITQAQFIAQMLYQQMKDSVISRLDSLYLAKCLQAKYQEQFFVEYVPKEYHFTLYYYDQAGNLVKTLPPAGVKPDYSSGYLTNVANSRSAGTDYPTTHNEALATHYRYNSLNQVIAQKTPDAGISKFWYDKLGRLVVSQNAEQALHGKYSYTIYDALGRITEVGQKPQSQSITAIDTRDPEALDNWLNANGASPGVQNREDITRTVYDISYFAGDDDLADVMIQRNLRNRVSYTQVFDTEPTGPDSSRYAGTHRAATHYSYDIHGNVDTLLQDYGNSTYNPNIMNQASNRYKKMAYNYDLISGKVNMVSYQPGKYYDNTNAVWRYYSDRFYHHYKYDAENRITEVYTSSDSLYWERDAAYEYYRHGPLARTVLGQLQVQGVDYAYTLHGWLKGVNSTTVSDGTYDIGKDGKAGSPNAIVGRDAYGFGLHYYQKDSEDPKHYDYLAIGSSVKPFANGSISGSAPYAELYNGNIGGMSVNIPKLGEAILNIYQYDQLNRLVKSYLYKGLNSSTNAWTKLNLPNRAYREQITYDPNGNIRTYKRNGDSARSNIAGTGMDNMTYTYKANKNQLDKVVDAATDASFANYPYYNDIKQGQANGNYTYDAIGNLKTDVSEEITNISWNVYGKIKNITKAADTIKYSYDASGNRISKTFDGKTTWYVRDASGNVMSTYITDAAINSGDLTQTEIHTYGSARLGVVNVKTNVETIPNPNSIVIFERAIKVFELSNHLGNVLATVSDKKLQHSTNSTTVNWYNADVMSANDYYPFGMMMPGRKYYAGSGYRYGFNGKENDNEVKGEGNQQDYGMRIYDVRIGKFLSVDPIATEYPMLSPYQFGSNRPIDGIDQDGLEWKPVTGANGNITDYKWAGFNADGSPVEGSQSGGKISNNGTTYSFGSLSIPANSSIGYKGLSMGTFSQSDGSNIVSSASIWNNFATFSFSEVNEDGNDVTTGFYSGYLGNPRGATGEQFAASLNSKFKEYEIASAPRPASGSIGDGYLPGEELFGGGTLKAIAGMALKKIVVKGIVKKTFATFGAAVVKREITKSVAKSSKGLLKEAGLPTTGKIRFVPRKSDITSKTLLRKDGGYVDRFGNIWKKGPSRTSGETFEWDVQLSKKGKSSIGHLSNDANKSHVNVSQKGIVTH